MLPGMRIILHLRCRSFRDLLIFLLSFSTLSLYVTYQLGTLSLSRNASQAGLLSPVSFQRADLWGGHLQLDDNYVADQTASKDVGDNSEMRDTAAPDLTRASMLRQKLRQLLVQIENHHLFALKNISKVALVRGQQSIISRDLPLYQDLLLRHQFTVKVPSSFPDLSFGGHNGSLRSMPNDHTMTKSPPGSKNVLSNWWVMLCMTNLDGDSEACLSKDSFPQLYSYQKINRILGIRNLLWSSEGFCNTLNEARQISVLRRKFISPLCFLLPDQYEQFLSVADALGEDTRWVLKKLGGRGRLELLPAVDQKLQNLLKLHDQFHPVMIQQFFPNPFLIFGSPVSLKVYALVTSVLPLRAYLFSEGLVNFRHDHQASFKKFQGRLWMMSQLWHYIGRNYGQQMVKTAILNMQHAIVQTLLFTEMKLAIQLASLSSNKSRDKYKCQHCFQLLGIELIFNSSFHPVILEVDGHPAMHESAKDDGWTGEKVKRSLLGNALDLLFSSQSVAEDVARVLEKRYDIVGVMGIDCLLSHELCLTNEDIRYLLDARREAKYKGGFRQIYPSLGMDQHSALLSELDNVLLSQQPSAISVDAVLSRMTSRHTTAELHSLLSYVEHYYSQEDNFNSSAFDPWMDAAGEIPPLPDDVSGLAGLTETDIDGRPKCSEDPSTLPYVRSIHTDPSIYISPPFAPAVMDYFANVSYDQLMVRVWAYALNCQSEARLDEKFGTSQPVNYTLGLGDNRISFVVVDIRHTEPWVINTYTLTIHRHGVTDAESKFDLQSPHEVCSIKQECELRVSLAEPCGIQKEVAQNWTEFLAFSGSLRFCKEGDASGRWVLPCKSCSQRNTCIWKQAIWSPFDCQHGFIKQEQLRKCLTGKKVLFIGDSTNRGIMHYLMERLNGTLTEWDKTHHLKVYNNINFGRTTLSFAYYPQFWLPTSERPVFEKALYQLLQRSRPLRNDSRTILIVGGVHWLATQHLHMLLRGLKREGLEGIRLMMKTLGSGFHLPVEGVHSLSKSEQRKLLLHSMGLAEFAKHYNFEVVDTFNITIPRYKDFLQGKCACHFHRVVPLDNTEENDVEAAPRTSDAGHSPLPWRMGQGTGQWKAGDIKVSRYHVEGPVNAAYSEILISRLCRQQRG